MQTLNASASLKMFDTLFAEARKEMFKAEVLQDYTAIDDSPSLRAWLAGNKKIAKSLAKSDVNILNWRQRCVASPAAITRTHITEEPLSPYLEWEIEVVYKDSLLASNAEKVYLVPHTSLGNTEIPDGDFWIFDNKNVLEWKYDAQGLIVGSYVWTSDESITRFLRLKELLLRSTIPI